MTPALRLRRFLYLDETLNRNFLAQLEGGTYDEEAQTTVTDQERKRGLTGRAGPIGAEVTGSRSGQDTASRTVRQVADGEFTRLMGLLEEAGAVQWLEAFDESIWRQLRRGEVLEAEVELSLPTLFQFTAMADSAGPMIELMKATGQQLDDGAEQGLQLVSQLSALFRDVVALARPVGSPDYTFIVSIDRQWLRTDLSDLRGEMTIMGTIERKLRENEAWSLLDVLGLTGLPDAQEMIDSLESSEDLVGNVVRPPAAVLSPIAIYR